MGNKISSAGKFGTVIAPPKGPGHFIGKESREDLIETRNCFWNPEFKVKLRAADGVSTIIREANFTMELPGWIAVLDLTDLNLGGGSNLNITRLRVKDDLGASLKCVTWDGTTEGGEFLYVAKDTKLRNTIASETQKSVTYSYTYDLGTADTGGNHYLVRTVSGSDATAETDDIVPPFLFNDEIRAVSIPAETLDGNVCTLMDLNTSGRAWASR